MSSVWVCAHKGQNKAKILDAFIMHTYTFENMYLYKQMDIGAQ